MKQDSVARADDRDLHALEARTRQAIADLREWPPRLSPIWFYDERGSTLFERICEQPEYYLTRVELGIMRAQAADIAAALGRDVVVIEPGSGASVKTGLLLDALEAPAAYVPIDISREHLLAAARRLQRERPWLRVLPVCADFTARLSMPILPGSGSRRRVVYFPGSTLGNFARDEAVALLRRLASLAGPGGAVLLGLDLVKPAAILERAYDDTAGLTAAFNLNALRHINRELGATFDLAAFEHRAPWVPEHERIEMHLVARRDLAFEVGPASFRLGRGDYLLTEYSHKYTQASAADIAAAAGLVVRRGWSDERGWFGVLLLESAPSPH